MWCSSKRPIWVVSLYWKNPRWIFVPCISLALMICDCCWCHKTHYQQFPDSKVYGSYMGPYGADRTQVGPMLARWTLLSGLGARKSPTCLLPFVTVYLGVNLMYIQGIYACSVNIWWTKLDASQDDWHRVYVLCLPLVESSLTGKDLGWTSIKHRPDTKMWYRCLIVDPMVWRSDMMTSWRGTPFALLTICEGTPPVIWSPPYKVSVTWTKQPSCWKFGHDAHETFWWNFIPFTWQACDKVIPGTVSHFSP